jgi:hypothetical protein
MRVGGCVALRIGLLLVLVLAGAFRSGEAAAQLLPRTPPTPWVKNSMVFYPMRGAPDACGPGCSEWIAAEGDFDPFSIGRLLALLGRLNGRKPPIFFDSPGGSMAHALALGRLIRERGLTTGVSRTVAQECATANRDTCKVLKTSGLTLNGELHSLAPCVSACVFALISGKERLVPPGAQVGVHSPTIIRRRPDGSQVAAAEVNAASVSKVFDDAMAKGHKHIRDMGIGEGLFEAIERTPYEDVHILSREEIAAFGIDTRPTIETPWTLIQTVTGSIFVGKFLTERRAEPEPTFRSRMIRFACGRDRRVVLGYGRESFEPKGFLPTSPVFEIGGAFFDLSQTAATDFPNPFYSDAKFFMSSEAVPLAKLEDSAADETVRLFESSSTTPMQAPLLTKLSTEGLVDALNKMKTRCYARN